MIEINPHDYRDKNMVVLDTDLLIAFLRGKLNSSEVFNDLKEQELSLNTTVFNIAELYKGCYSTKNVAKGLIKVGALVESLDNILQFDEKAIDEYAKISADLKKRGLPIGTMDELIASICLAQNEPIYTGNIKHYEKISELALINWMNLIKND
ncbi:MAG: type II toxin-antitoxin system VapC family toxin [Promethearchaeota archaeon]